MRKKVILNSSQKVRIDTILAAMDAPGFGHPYVLDIGHRESDQSTMIVLARVGGYVLGSIVLDAKGDVLFDPSGFEQQVTT